MSELAEKDRVVKRSWAAPGGMHDFLIRAMKILLPAGGRRLKSRYQEAGIETFEVEVDELIKAGGGIHCMTAFLRREEV